MMYAIFDFNENLFKNLENSFIISLANRYESYSLSIYESNTLNANCQT